MSKEKLLEAFDKEFGKDGFYVETSIDCNNNYTNTEIKQFISKAIDQTREETIRECEGLLPEENYGHEDNCSTEYKNGWNDCREEIHQSLINLRSK